MSEPFYIYLPSNTKSPIYSSNTAASFKIDLPKPLIFNPSARCGLVEIHFPTLCFKQEDKKKKKESKEGEEVEEEARDQEDLIFVYCDLIKSSIIGDQRAPILRALSPTPKENKFKGTSTSLIFENIQYFPIRGEYISTIEVKFTSKSGEVFPFEDGSTLLCLHVKP